jgi:hypothetical protein
VGELRVSFSEGTPSRASSGSCVGLETAYAFVPGMRELGDASKIGVESPLKVGYVTKEAVVAT